MLGHVKAAMLAIGLGSMLVLGVNTGHARAAQDGVHGFASVSSPVCVVSGSRQLYQVLPAIYSANLTPGAGNDRQIVRYWSRVVSYSTGAPVTDWLFGGRGDANDNVPASLPARGTIYGSPFATWWNVTGGPVREEYLFAWYTERDAYLGSASLVSTSYRSFHNGGLNITYAC